MKKILIVFGTRPEAIKMAPLYEEFSKYDSEFQVKVCITGQHKEMLNQVIDFFGIVPDYDLKVMKKNQDLFSITSSIISKIKNVFFEYQPDYTFVHGDTTTSMASGLASFYSGSKVCHVEAGLRTYNKLSPFPEEMNRQITARISDLHYAPTLKAKDNLINEGINDRKVIVTGNTVIDALFLGINKLKNYNSQDINKLKKIIEGSNTNILVTGHRRENIGLGFNNICEALLEICSNNKNVKIIFPVHLNPRVRDTVNKLLSNNKNIHLIEPLSYPDFIWLMTKSKLIITDSGGIQEEAPSLGIPVLVTRDTTERPEAVSEGTVKLVGSNKELIVSETNKLLNNKKYYSQMSSKTNPYGDGKASSRIVNHMIEL